MTVPPIFVWSVFVLLVLMATAPLWRLAVFGFNPALDGFSVLRALKAKGANDHIPRPLAASVAASREAHLFVGSIVLAFSLPSSFNFPPPIISATACLVFPTTLSLILPMEALLVRDPHGQRLLKHTRKRAI